MTKAKTQPGQGTVLARVLVECDMGKPNDVVEVDPELAKTMEEVLDTAPEAVEYAQSLAKE